MLIRKIIILFTLSLFSFGLSFYIFQNLSPFNIEKLQALADKLEIEVTHPEKLDEEIQSIIRQGFVFEFLSPSAYAAFFLFLFGIFFGFSSIHFLVDKLFFKKFYEKPSNFLAFRRAFLIAATVGVFIVMNLLQFDLQTMFISVLVGILIEVMFLLFWRKKVKKDL